MVPKSVSQFENTERGRSKRINVPFSPHIVRVEQSLGDDQWEEYTWANVRLEGRTVILLSLPRGRFRVTVLGIVDPEE